MKPFISFILLLCLCSCGSDENDSITDCRIIGGSPVFASNGNYIECVESSTKE